MNRWIVGVSLLCLLASCSKDNDDTPQSGNNNVNGGAGISFSSNVSSSIIVEVDGPTSRAPLTTFEPNSQIGIYGIPAFEGGRNEDCDVIPYNEDVTWREVGSVAEWATSWKLNTTDMSATVDYMFTGPMQADYSKVGTNPVVLNFQHAFGRLDFRFYSTSKEVCDVGYRIKSVTVYCNTGESGWMSIATGELSFSSRDLICTYPAGNAGITYNTPGEAVAKFMFPPEQTLIQKITCTMQDGGGNSRDYTIYDYKYYGYDVPIKKGKTTLMRINFLPKDATFSGPANVDSWTNGTTIDKDVKLQ